MPLRGERLRARRIELGLSQEELASQLQTVQNHISRLETGKVEPSTDMLERLSKALDISVDYLLGLTDTPHSEILSSDLTIEEALLLKAYRMRDVRLMLEMLLRALTDVRQTIA